MFKNVYPYNDLLLGFIILVSNTLLSPVKSVNYANIACVKALKL